MPFWSLKLFLRRNRKDSDNYLRLNIAAILLAERKSDRKLSQLSMSSSEDTIIRALADVLEKEGSEHSINELLSLLSPHSSQVKNNLVEERVWICEILERVSNNREHAEKLNKLWRTTHDMQLKEALAHMQWAVTRRQSSEMNVRHTTSSVVIP